MKTTLITALLGLSNAVQVQDSQEIMMNDDQLINLDNDEMVGLDETIMTEAKSGKNFSCSVKSDSRGNY